MNKETKKEAKELIYTLCIAVLSSFLVMQCNSKMRGSTLKDCESLKKEKVSTSQDSSRSKTHIVRDDLFRGYKIKTR